MNSLFLLLPLLLLVSSISAITCNASSYEFTSDYSLGKQDELNTTFDKIQNTLPPFPDMTYIDSNTGNTYTILNFTAVFRYIDSAQKAEVVDNDTVIVKDGYLVVDFRFNWTSRGEMNKEGTASGTGRTEGIHFGKDIVINKEGFLMWDLVDVFKIVWTQDPLQIKRLDPYNPTDLQVLEQMLNKPPSEDEEALKVHWLGGINNLLPHYLNDSLHDEYDKLQRYINYTYVDKAKGNITVTFEHFLIAIKLNRDGLNMNFSTVIKDYADFDCGKPVPSTHKDTAQYGGIQEFISVGVFKSTAAYALSIGAFDTVLDEDNWESPHFQFFAGDLYDVVPNLQKKYHPNNKLNGSCKALKSGFDLVRGGIHSLNVTLSFNCSLNGNNTDKILDMEVKTNLTIGVSASTDKLDFVVQGVQYSVLYSSTSQYPISNMELANYYVDSTIHSLRGSRVFGSGFPTHTRDYPHLEVNNDYVFIYDSSQVHQAQQ